MIFFRDVQNRIEHVKNEKKKRIPSKVFSFFKKQNYLLAKVPRGGILGIGKSNKRGFKPEKITVTLLFWKHTIYLSLILGELTVRNTQEPSFYHWIIYLWNVSLSSSLTNIFNERSSWFQLYLSCVSLSAGGMSSNISSRGGRAKS